MLRLLSLFLCCDAGMMGCKQRHQARVGGVAGVELAISEGVKRGRRAAVMKAAACVRNKGKVGQHGRKLYS